MQKKTRLLAILATTATIVGSTAYADYDQKKLYSKKVKVGNKTMTVQEYADKIVYPFYRAESELYSYPSWNGQELPEGVSKKRINSKKKQLLEHGWNLKTSKDGDMSFSKKVDFDLLCKDDPNTFATDLRCQDTVESKINFYNEKGTPYDKMLVNRHTETKKDEKLKPLSSEKRIKVKQYARFGLSSTIDCRQKFEKGEAYDGSLKKTRSAMFYGDGNCFVTSPRICENVDKVLNSKSSLFSSDPIARGRDKLNSCMKDKNVKAYLDILSSINASARMIITSAKLKILEREGKDDSALSQNYELVRKKDEGSGFMASDFVSQIKQLAELENYCKNYKSEYNETLLTKERRTPLQKLNSMMKSKATAE